MANARTPATDGPAPFTPLAKLPVSGAAGANRAGSRAPRPARPRSERVQRIRRQLLAGKPVGPDVIMSFARQTASFLDAGISIVETLEVVREEIGSPAMKAVIDDMSAAIQRGASFADAVAAHPSVFPGYFRAIVRSAEYTGHLDTVLLQLAAYLERDIAARRQVKSALTYPTVVLVVATAAMAVMAVFVLPKFSGMYRSLGAKLPLPTRMLLAFTDFVSGSWPVILAVIAGVLVSARIVIGGHRGKRRRDLLAMRLPVIGDLYQLISLERFCRVLAALATAGVPLPDAIQMSADSTNNTIFQRKLAVVKDALIRGEGLSGPMFDAGVFPLAARQMIRVGERTGTLGHQLGRAANHYEREVGFHMKRATELFQPAIILFVGLVVGFVAVAQVAAMYSIFGQLK